MKEYPVFIPSGQEQIGTVITVPDGEPRGLVLLLAGGGGAPRSHRYGMFTKLARSLAEEGIASARMEWRGVGDSTGSATYSFRVLPVEDVVTVARFALKATGTTVLGMAANCGGARTSMKALPRIPEARGAVLMMLKPRAGTRSKKPTVLKAKLLLKRVPAIGPLVRKAYWATRWRKGSPVFDGLRSVNQISDVLVLEADTVKVGKLPRIVASLQAKNGRHRLEMRTLPGGATKAFQSLERQEYAVDSTVEWFDQLFPARGAGPADGHGASPNGERSESIGTGSQAEAGRTRA
jgi:alpha/beta superfamily hydrolase